MDFFENGLNVYLTCNVNFDTSNLLAVEALKIGVYAEAATEKNLVHEILHYVDQTQTKINSRFDTTVLLMYPLLLQRHRGMADILLVKASKSEYDLKNNTSSEINITVLIDFFLDEVSLKCFLSKSRGGVQLDSYGVCENMFCRNLTKTVFQPVSSAKTMHMPISELFVFRVLLLITLAFM